MNAREKRASCQKKKEIKRKEEEEKERWEGGEGEERRGQKTQERLIFLCTGAI